MLVDTSIDGRATFVYRQRSRIIHLLLAGLFGGLGTPAVADYAYYECGNPGESDAFQTRGAVEHSLTKCQKGQSERRIVVTTAPPISKSPYLSLPPQLASRSNMSSTPTMGAGGGSASPAQAVTQEECIKYVSSLPLSADTKAVYARSCGSFPSSNQRAEQEVAKQMKSPPEVMGMVSKLLSNN